MNIIWTRSIVSLALLAVLCAAIGAFAGVRVALAVAVVMLVVQSFVSTYHTQRLWRLLDAPVYGQVPSALGIWGEIYYRLHKLAKRWHAQVRQVEQQHSRFIQAIQASPNGVAMLDDHDRPLAARGIRAVKMMGQHIRDAGIHPEQVLCSSSRRTRETLDALAPGGETLIEHEIYDASCDTLVERLRRVPAGITSVGTCRRRHSTPRKFRQEH